MPIESKRLAISLVLVAALLLPSPALAQSTTAPTNDWSGLKAVASGSKLVVKLKNGKTVKGKLSGVTDTALSMSVSDRPLDLNREEVLSVHLTRGESATTPTLIGAGVGAAAGVTIGAIGSSKSDGFDKLDQAVTAGLTVIGAGVGAITGFAIGKSRKKRVLVYEARQP